MGIHGASRRPTLSRVTALCGVSLFVGVAAAAAAATTMNPPLVICADPNNLPFSNRAEAGFENKIAALVAKDLGRPIAYVWWAQRRGYVRNTLNESKCDLWPGVASGVDTVSTTDPYYRSTYVFVSRASASFQHLTLDDARLRHASIGVQMIGNDAMNSPPAHAVASRGMVDNVRGYMLYGDYSQPNPPAAIVSAVAQGEIDVALVWGPLAGYFAARSPTPLRLEPVTPAGDARWPMVFDISMGVRRGDAELLARVNETLRREGTRIDEILRSYRVPLENMPGGPASRQ